MTTYETVHKYTNRMLTKYRTQYAEETVYAAVTGNLESLLMDALYAMDEEARTKFITRMNAKE